MAFEDRGLIMNSVATVLTIVFVVLKLTEVIAWSWLWVLSPLWIGFIIWLFFVIVFVIIGSKVKTQNRQLNESINRFNKRK